MSIFKRLTGHHRSETVRLKEILFVIWEGRKSYIKWGIGGLVIGLIICFSIPKEYIVRVLIAQENNSAGKAADSDNVLLAALFSSIAAEDAYNSDTYAPLLNSVPLLYDLLSVKIQTTENKSGTSVQEVLKAEKHPWWNLPANINLPFLQPHDFPSHSESPNKYTYSEEEWKMIENLRQRILLATIESTGAMELEVRMQDPIAAAQLADTIRRRFEERIHTYRIQKAQNKLEYALAQEENAKTQWHQLQDSLGKYVDSHQKLSTEQGRINSRRLRNDANLAFRNYQSTVLERAVAETNLYEIKPVFTTVSPSTVPLKAARPRKLLILSYWLFFSVFISMVRYLFTHSARI